MKITQTADEYNNYQKLKYSALKNCDKCPCCGETKSHLEYIKEGTILKGISSLSCKCWYGKQNGGFYLFRDYKNKHWKVDLFVCYTCGAEWKSEPYEYL